MCLEVTYLRGGHIFDAPIAPYVIVIQGSHRDSVSQAGTKTRQMEAIFMWWEEFFYTEVLSLRKPLRSETVEESKNVTMTCEAPPSAKGHDTSWYHHIHHTTCAMS